jgi:hypothetical protein
MVDTEQTPIQKLTTRVQKLDKLFKNDMPDYITLIKDNFNHLMKDSEIQLSDSLEEVYDDFSSLYTTLSDSIKLLVIVDKNLSVTTDSSPTFDVSSKPPIRGDVSDLLAQADRSMKQADDLMLDTTPSSRSLKLQFQNPTNLPTASSSPPHSPNPTNTSLNQSRRDHSVGSEIKELRTTIFRLSQSLSESKKLSRDVQRSEDAGLKEKFKKTLKTIGDFKKSYDRDYVKLRKQIKFLYKKCLFLFLFLDAYQKQLNESMKSDLNTFYKPELTSTKQGEKYVDTLYDLILSQNIFTPKEICELTLKYRKCITRLEQNPKDGCINHINHINHIEGNTNTTLQYIFSTVTILLLLL